MICILVTWGFNLHDRWHLKTMQDYPVVRGLAPFEVPPMQHLLQIIPHAIIIALIIYAISLFFEQFTQLTVIANAFKGIQVCVIYLIFSAGVRMLQALDRSLFSSGVLLSVFLAMTSLSLAGISVSSILLILLSGAAGVAAWLLGRRKEGK